MDTGEALRRLAEGRLHDPFSVLGRHPAGGGDVIVRAFLPGVESAEIVESGEPMVRIDGGDLFEWRGSGDRVPVRYRIRSRRDGRLLERYDPYAFEPQVSDGDMESFGRGDHFRSHWFLGPHARRVDGVDGVRFALWAPNAERVSVVGDFNEWDGRRHPMRVRGGSGVWELFVPGLDTGALYKFEIRNRRNGRVLTRSDPFSRCFETRPRTASRIAPDAAYVWSDAAWLEARTTFDWRRAPISVYELHCGSWARGPSGEFLDYRALADRLVPYLEETGFTHVELLPLTEHPLDASWGYQATGYFAPTSRYGGADDLRYLIDRLHGRGIGVILDWVPGHFPRDEHGLAAFDGEPLFEYADPLKAEQRDWGTLAFNYDRREVRSFLISSALYWLEEFHFDGLRVDAVAAMLYLDYSREPGQWTPNVHGGNENLEAVGFLRALNEAAHLEFPGALVIAEESTAWPGVTRPTHAGGLGFSLKWNMGWMHDTLDYFSMDPVHRKHHHDRVTFGPVYAFSENFLLPLSHDEVVHGKGSLLAKMPGDRWQQLANLRLLFTFQWTFPGKKLLFMGSEMGQPSEWNHDGQLPWALLDRPEHAGVGKLVGDLNRLYRTREPLHARDFESSGFRWLRWDDRDSSVLSYLRVGSRGDAVVVLNFTPIPRTGYRIGVPRSGAYREILNSDSRYYGGSDVGNPAPIVSENVPCMEQPYSIPVTLPPLAGIVLEAP